MSYIPVHTVLAVLEYITPAQGKALTDLASRYDGSTGLHHVNVVTGRSMHLPETYIGFELYSNKILNNVDVPKPDYECILVGGIDAEGRIST